MRADLYSEMARVEDTHWWFRARRTIIRTMLQLARLKPGAQILDVGSGTGGNLPMLAEFGSVSAVEMDDAARDMANARKVVNVQPGKLPDMIPFGEQLYDLAVMFDVLEHVEEDFGTLVALHQRLAAGGKLLMTVPAFESLWSEHDVIHHHKRRYSLLPLIRLVERAGYKVTHATYINFWLFPLIAAVRLLDRMTSGKLLGKKQGANAELITPPGPLNKMLECIFSSEACVIPRMRLPFGVSIILLADKI